MRSFKRQAGAQVLAILLIGCLWVQPALAQSSIRDTEIEQMLQDWSDPIFVAGGLAPGAVDIYVLNDPSLNAFVAGGQNMFVHTGLITAAETPNELIGVIAHETGHISGGHLARMGEAAEGFGLTQMIGLGLGLAAIAMGSPEAGIALVMGGSHIAQRQFLQYSRTQEASADQAALNYLNATGQSGRGLLTFFDRFRDQEILVGANQDPFIRSHPLNSDRINLLEQHVLASPYSDVPDSPEQIERLHMVQAKIYGFLDRVDVVMRRYPESDMSAPAIYARSVAYFRQGRTNDALDEIDSLIVVRPENPFLHELRGQILLEGGRAEESLASFRRSVELMPQAPLLRINLAQALIASDNSERNTPRNQEALELLQFATTQDNTSSFAWHQMAIAQARSGNEGLADLATAERYYLIGDFAEARRFAIRAHNKIPENTEDWRQAMEIIDYTEDPRRRRRP